MRSPAQKYKNQIVREAALEMADIVIGLNNGFLKAVMRHRPDMTVRELLMRLGEIPPEPDEE